MKKILAAALMGLLAISSYAQAANQTVAVRISGLVCDLCVGGIEKQLKQLPSVQGVVVAPRYGLVALDATSSVDEKALKTILVEAGYRVHQVSISAVPLAAIRSNPEKQAQTIWKGGAAEQKQVLASAPANANVCAGRVKPQEFGSSSAAVAGWGK